uniref:Metalloendopeptidase n=1 Tax=Meloidogyne enterolobii TaxID=390850 RepID=A0A6V7U5L1_MELEN|nr:unnamed protein product [Meloidogyne enterolobii]
MLAIAENTCIKFERRGGEADYVDLKNERGEGCYTMVGRSSGRNIVMLETNEIATCLEYEIVIHELMHTIGLWHEQMRYDRDEYIKVHWENIGPAYLTQFEKVPETDSTTYGVRYDYQSVMHYAKDAFASATGKITMETLDSQYQAFKKNLFLSKYFLNLKDIIGKVKDAAPSDYLKICNIYSCQTCMGRPFIPGQNYPEIGQRVLTLGPWPVTLPTGSPSPATLPLRPTTTTMTTTTIRTTRPRTTRRRTTTATWAPPPTCPPPPPPPPQPPSIPIEIEKEEENNNNVGERRWPTPQLPIILPLINNNWWWKNTPAPPFRYPPLLRRQMDVEEEDNKSREEEMDEIEEDDEDEEKMEENRREEEEGRKNEENWLGRWEKQWNEKIEEKEGFEEGEENNEDIWGNKEELFQCLEDSICKKLFKRNLQRNIGKNKLKKICRLKRGVMRKCCNKCKKNNGRIKRNN